MVYLLDAVDAAPASDVEWFLFTAGSSACRAYTHLRLCILPVILTLHKENPENGLFLLTVLCELLENLAKIFCMSCYKPPRQTQQLQDNDFPYLFFPPTPQFFAENHNFYFAYTEEQLGSGRSPAVDELDCGDTLEDVVGLYCAVLQARPDFALSFWPDNDSPSGGMAASGYVHPFVMQVMPTDMPILCRQCSYKIIKI